MKTGGGDRRTLQDTHDEQSNAVQGSLVSNLLISFDDHDRTNIEQNNNTNNCLQI